MVNFPLKEHYEYADLLEIVRLLRAPGGCPWDGEQTHASIRRNFIEEVYEVCEAIDNDDPDGMREELGDVLLQVVFHADIEREAGRFTESDVCDAVCRKLILRHPHVFGDVQADTTEQVLTNWDEIKRREKHQTSYADTLRAVAVSLPALWRADKLISKAEKAGFAWPDALGALGKLTEETAELNAAAAGEGDVEEELGDVLFAAVCAGRQFGIDPEAALRRTCEKFIARFSRMERAAEDAGLRFSELSPAEQGKLWEKIKHEPD